MRRSRPVIAVLLSLVVMAAVAANAQAAPYEPNDTAAQATGPISGGKDYEGAIETSNDADFYFANLKGQRQIDIALANVSGCEYDDVYVRTPDGDSVTSSGFGYDGEVEHILYTTRYTRQYVIEVSAEQGCSYKLRIDPADAVTTDAPGIVALLNGGDDDCCSAHASDDVQRVFVDGNLVGTQQGSESQAFDLGALDPSSTIAFEAENGTAGWAWDVAIVSNMSRNESTVFSERESNSDDDARTGLVRRVVMSPSGGIHEQCGEVLAPSICNAPQLPPPPPPPTPEVSPSSTAECRTARTRRAKQGARVKKTKRLLLRAKRKSSRRRLTVRLRKQRRKLSTVTATMRTICNS